MFLITQDERSLKSKKHFNQNIKMWNIANATLKGKFIAMKTYQKGRQIYNQSSKLLPTEQSQSQVLQYGSGMFPKAEVLNLWSPITGGGIGR